MLTVRGSVASFTAASAAYGAARSTEKGIERLSTGNRINAARDDAAGVAIGSRMLSSIAGLQQGIRNALDCQSLLHVTDESLSSIEDALQRLRELAVQAANDTNSNYDRKALQTEADSIVCHIDAIAKSSNWAGKKLLDGSFSDKSFLIGAGHNEADFLRFSVPSATAFSLGLARIDADETSLSNNAAPDVTQENATVGAPSNEHVENVNLADEANPITSNTVKEYRWSSVDSTLANGSIYDNSYTITSNKEIKFTNNEGWHLFPEEFQIEAGINTVKNSEIQTYEFNFENPTNGLLIAFETIGRTGHPLEIEFDFDINIGWSLIADGSSVEKTGTKTIVGREGYAIIEVPDNSTSFRIEFKTAENYTRMYLGGEEPQESYPDTDVNENPDPENADSEPSTNSYSWCSSSFISVTSSEAATSALSIITNAITLISSNRAFLGSLMNRIDYSISHNTNMSTNLEISRGRIMDADFAIESKELAKNAILHQASTAMVAQANESKRNILELVKQSSTNSSPK